ncbi:MAG TPA: hypothetical protein DEB09_03345 [Candidatus Magasanikbacteria bacterium]|nr:hypothetical protein [Candidatus Magasanikbacteria bacterium]
MEEKLLQQNLVANRWQTLTLSEQLGNIGSEIGRALGAQKQNKEEKKIFALNRAFELFNLTIGDSRWLSRLKELTRGREVVADYFFGDNVYNSTAENLEKYFYWFALAARKNR